MKILRSPAAMLEAVQALRHKGKTIGFVPTMGALHEGHLSLLRKARGRNDRVVASIFVNPLQFGPREDLAAYPRPKARDHALLAEEGCDLLFEPAAERFYPVGFATRVEVQGLDQRLCGAFRKGHFLGVTTVVAKLLVTCAPDRLYLGRKDYQQAVILERMIEDLNLPVDVVVCPTVREKDGLAMSSRNAYLTPEERAWAPNLYRALRETAGEIASGRIRRPQQAEEAVARRLQGGSGRLQYAEVLQARDLSVVDPLRGPLVLAAACFLGRARLIDNVPVRAPEAPARAAASRVSAKASPSIKRKGR